jgi:glucose-1-phosphate adenylyltransferase
MDYGPFLAIHNETKADMSVSCVEVPCDEAAGQLGVMTVDENNRVIAFDEKPEKPNSIPGKPGFCLASMGNYVFNTEFLYEQLIKDADTKESQHDFGKNLIPAIIKDYRVYAYPFRDPQTGKQAYWRDVGTLDAYWEANMELVSVTPQLNLYDTQWPVFTHQTQAPPAKFVFDEDDRRGMATQSMVSGGCVVSGSTVKNSLLFSRCKTNAHAKISDSVLLPDVVIGEKARLKRCIIDSGSIIKDGMVICEDHDLDRERGFRVTESGLTLVTPDMLDQQLHHTR